MVKKDEIDFYDPFRNASGNFFDNFFEPFGKMNFPKIRTPLVNVRDEGKSILISIELPGTKKEDIMVDAHEDYIKIEAKIKDEDKEEKKNYYRYEMRSSSFSRAIPMPEKIIPEKVSGELKNGILELSAPKANPKLVKKTKRVQIK